MRLALPLIAVLLAPASAAAATKTASSKKPAASAAAPAAKKQPTGVSDASVAAAVQSFIDALASLDDEKILATLTPGDRVALRGHATLGGLVQPQKLQNATVKSWEKAEDAGKVIGAKVVVTVEEVDPASGINQPKEKTWVFALDAGNVLRLDIASLWLDSERITDEGRGEQ
jgi:hypothetical protein